MIFELGIEPFNGLYKGANQWPITLYDRRRSTYKKDR